MAIWRNRRNPPQQSSATDWFINHLKGNVFTSLTALVMVFGLCAIYGYHFHIEYFPLISIESFSSMIFATTYVGIILLFAFIVSMLLPGLVIGFVWKNGEAARSSQQQKTYLSKLFGAAFLQFLIWVVVLVWGPDNVPASNAGLYIFFMYFAIHYVARLIWQLKQISWRVRGFERKHFLSAGTHVFPYSLMFLMQVFTILMFTVIQRDAPDVPTTNGGYIAIFNGVLHAYLILLVWGYFFLTFWFGEARPIAHKIAILFGAVFVPVVMSFFLGNIAFFPATIARVTKVGNFYASELIISNAGCAILARSGGLSCPEKEGEVVKLCGGYVMSRLGSETYIKVNFDKTSIGNHKVQISENKKSETEKSKTEKSDPFRPESIFLPTSAILGMKVDMSVRYENNVKIDEYLKQHPSICPVVAAKEKENPFIFKETDLFDHGSFDLTANGKKNLGDLIRVIADNKKPVSEINITGHTDQTGTAHYNMTLSQMRALSVENYFRTNFATDSMPKNIHSQGAGNTRPKKTISDCSKNASEKGQLACLAMNRRVEIEIIFK